MALRPDLTGINPDENITSFSYDKGMLFFATIEQVIGKDQMAHFMRTYLNRYAFQSVAWPDVLKVLIELHPDIETKIDFNDWLYGADLPTNHFVPTSPKLEQIQAALQCWLDGTGSLNSVDCSDQPSLKAVLGDLNSRSPKTLSSTQMAELNNKLNMANYPVSLDRMAWFQLVIKNQFEPAYPDVFREAAAWPTRLFRFTEAFVRYLPEPQNLLVARRLVEETRPFANALGVNRCELFLASHEKTSKE